MSICVIFNPKARGEKATRFQQALQAVRGRFSLKPTLRAGDARRLAAEAIREGFLTIVAAGGDGTLNEVLNGMGDVPDGFSRARLGVLPLGTINVFARELRIPLKLDQVWPILEAGHETNLDVAEAEFQTKAGPEKRLFLQLGGAGLDARSVELVSWELKKKVGGLAYLIAGLRALGGPRPRIQVSNGAETLTGDLVLIGNGKLYGGEYPIFHKSDLQDGKLDAVVIDRVQWTNLPLLASHLLLGRLFKEGRTGYLQGSELSFKSDARAALQLDGEFAGELPARISVLPKRVRVVIAASKDAETSRSQAAR